MTMSRGAGIHVDTRNKIMMQRVFGTTIARAALHCPLSMAESESGLLGRQYTHVDDITQCVAGSSKNILRYLVPAATALASGGKSYRFELAGDQPLLLLLALADDDINPVLEGSCVTQPHDAQPTSVQPARKSINIGMLAMNGLSWSIFLSGTCMIPQGCIIVCTSP
eukprot:TRINITY_DN10365_c2_g1_i1.p1 TRINITY_DN10365_c2_g1~~TRINITY_DN10365_c2_g1_i1.p1  ORF type:complete len:167 (-),score=13.57 TRINITY_DN10365_c2_g1_i1:415-915(-)